MKVTLRNILISDDVRVEKNGKLIVIGLFSGDLLVPAFPASVPLAFTAGIVFDGSGPFELLGVLKRQNSDEALLSFGATGMAAGSGSAYVPFRFPLVTLKESGGYDVSLAVKGQQGRLSESLEVRRVEP